MTPPSPSPGASGLAAGDGAFLALSGGSASIGSNLKRADLIFFGVFSPFCFSPSCCGAV